MAKNNDKRAERMARSNRNVNRAITVLMAGVNAEFYLLRTSDGWKIATSSDYGYGEDYSFDDNNSDSVADESKAESEIVPDSSAESSDSAENTDSEGADSVE